MSGDFNSENTDAGYELDPEFLQRTPSHITIRQLTELKRSNTYPRVKRENDGLERKSAQSLFKTHNSSPAAPRVRFALDDETETNTKLEETKTIKKLEERNMESDYKPACQNTEKSADDENAPFMTASFQKDEEALFDVADGGTLSDELNCEQEERSVTEGSVTMENKDVEVVRPQDLGIRADNSQEEEDQSGFIFPKGFLQRPPSHITVKNITTCKHYNTYPNLQKEFNRAKERTKLVNTQMSSPPSQNVQDPDQLVQELNDGTENHSKLPCESQYKNEGETHIEDVPDHGRYLESKQEVNIKIECKDDSILSESSVCMECVKAIEVTKCEDIRIGDHIIFSGRIYDHHAIVVKKPVSARDKKDVVVVKKPESEHGRSDNPESEHDRTDEIVVKQPEPEHDRTDEVVVEKPVSANDKKDEVVVEMVHATNTSAKATFASLHPFGSKARLRRVRESVDLKSQKVMVVKYSSDVKPFSRGYIVKRAIDEANADLAGGQGQFKYNLFQNNCEHFATWCVTGRKLSLQVRKFSMVFWMFLKSGFYDISNEFIRNEKEYESGMLCENCYSRNKKLLDIPKEKISKESDVNPGDIIMYSYYLLWHCAVVLNVIKKRHNYVKCEVAHYAYMGMFEHRKIITEHLLIPLDGTVMVAIYPDDLFNVYSPDEVVKRARSRVDEQMFAFFTNDSSQFSRWCKLKLELKNINRHSDNFVEMKIMKGVK